LLRQNLIFGKKLKNIFRKNKSQNMENALIEMPIFCIIGVVTNTLNAAVFIHRKMKDISFKYLFIMSLAEVFYLGFSIMGFMTFCNDCDSELVRSYSFQVYNIYIFRYLVRVIAFFIILCEIFLSLQRYMVLLNKKFLKPTSHYYLLFGLLVISFMFYLPEIFMKSIVSIENSYQNVTFQGYKNVTVQGYKNVTVQGFKNENNYFGNSKIGKAIIILIVLIRAVLVSIVMPIINFLSFYEFRKRYNREEIHINNLGRKTRNAVNKKKSLTLTVICSSFLFIISQLPFLINRIWEIFSPPLILMYEITYGILIIAHNLNICIYFAFNKLYRKILLSYFKYILPIKSKNQNLAATQTFDLNRSS